MSAQQWARDVYATDKRAAELCREMTITGFGFDRAKAHEIAVRLRDDEMRALAAADAAVGRQILRGKGGGFSTKDLQVAFFGDLKAPVFFRSQLTNAPSLGVDSMRAYSACASERLRALALAVLAQRRARKLRTTYVEGVPVGGDGRVHPSWLNYGAVSGRWACQGPNLMNLPTPRKDPTCVWEGDKLVDSGIRGLYCARPGWVLVTFDKKQLEMRIAAYASGDDAMIAACESEDLHARNAEVIWGAAFTGADKATRKALRTIAKSAGFAVCYLAEAATVYTRIVQEGVAVTLRAVEQMLRKLRSGFATYYKWQDRRLLDCVKWAWTDTPILGRRRWLGHEPAPTECANFPIQGGAADVMNADLPVIVARLRDAVPRARIVAQVHDSAVFECPADDRDRVVAIVREVSEAPIMIASSGRELRPVLPIDIEISERWS